MNNFDKLQIYNSCAESISDDIYDKVIDFDKDKINLLLSELVENFVKVNKLQQLLGEQIKQDDKVGAVLGVKKVFKHKNEITCILILKNGSIASGSLDTCIKIWDLNTGKCIKSLDGHTHAVLCVIELENGFLASGSLDQTAIVWNTSTGNIVNMLEGFQNPIIGLVELNSETLVINFNEPLLLLWNWNSKSKSNSAACSYGSSPFTCMTKMNSENVLVGCEDGKIVRFSPSKSDKEICIYDKHTDVVLSIDGSINNSTDTSKFKFFSNSTDLKLILWDFKVGQPLKVMEFATDIITCFHFDPELDLLVFTCLDGKIRGVDISYDSEDFSIKYEIDQNSPIFHSIIIGKIQSKFLIKNNLEDEKEDDELQKQENDVIQGSKDNLKEALEETKEVDNKRMIHSRN